MFALAFQLLAKEKRRLLLGSLGVAFGVVLMFMQFGFQKSLFDSAVLMHSRLNGDLVLVAPESTSLVNMKQFSERRLCQALASNDLEAVCPIYLGFAGCSNKYGDGTRRIFVIAFKPEDNVFRISGIERQKSLLHAEDEVLFDELSRKEFGPLAAKMHCGKPVSLVIANHKVKLAGTFELGTSFGADGNMVTSDSTFFRMGFQQTRKPGLIDIGLIRLKEGSNPLKVQRELQNTLPNDVRVLTIAELSSLEKNYWRQSTAIGFIFSVGVVLGLVVGAVIVYQILYADVNDHLAEYATLKAMGYSDFYLTDVILQEAVILAFSGFFPGLLLSAFLYALTKERTGLPIELSLELSIFVMALSLVMCCLSGWLASLRLRLADPVECF